MSNRPADATQLVGRCSVTAYRYCMPGGAERIEVQCLRLAGHDGPHEVDTPGGPQLVSR